MSNLQNKKYLSKQFYKHCKDKAIEICKEFDVDESFYDLFTEWFTDLCLDSDKPLKILYSMVNDKDLIDEWWDQELCKSANLTPYINYEPTDHEMMSSFGTRWHDGL